MEDHEDISAEDVERFSAETRTCSECGADVYDSAEICQECGHAFTQADDGWKMPKWAYNTALLILGAIVLGVLIKVLLITQ